MKVEIDNNNVMKDLQKFCHYSFMQIRLFFLINNFSNVLAIGIFTIPNLNGTTYILTYFYFYLPPLHSLFQDLRMG